MWALNSIDASRRNRSTLLFSIMDPMEGLLPGAERSDDDDFCIDDMDDYQLFNNIADYHGDTSDNSSAVRGDLEERAQQPKGTKRGPSRREKVAEKKRRLSQPRRLRREKASHVQSHPIRLFIQKRGLVTLPKLTPQQRQ